MSIAIKVENLSKAYQLGEIGTGTLSNDLKRWAYKVRGKEDPFLKIGETNDRTTKGESDMVWSLKDINFEIEQGDAVGIIGRNGAGKSTLLKILSRVTSPTTGSVKVKGRVASLLEVGTGFHPELSGRDNIFLNGAILGMRKHEIKKHFDAIVDFAGVERYIDTPVKRYSSGMYVRLAFAVAAHLESEILVVDEVLAVGDAEFQKKCLGKMNDVSKGEGRTVLFVSHNISSVKSLCSKGLHLDKGLINLNGTIDTVIQSYLDNDIDLNKEYIPIFTPENHLKDDFYITKIELKNVKKCYENHFKINEDIEIEINYTLTLDLIGSVINFQIDKYDATIALSFDTDFNEERLNFRPKGKYKATILIPAFTLKPGDFYLTFATGIANSSTSNRYERCLRISVNLESENEAFISYAEKRPGSMPLKLNWDTIKL
jgi:lipopolysaccharide transport system ATP-binding protein